MDEFLNQGAIQVCRGPWPEAQSEGRGEPRRRCLLATGRTDQGGIEGAGAGG